VIRSSLASYDLARRFHPYATLQLTYGVARVAALKPVKLVEGEGYVTVIQGWRTHVADLLPET
jgi:hypothetical protein